jgi:hypothetical protein
MSEFEDTSDDQNRICPYCGYSYQPESEDHSPDRRVETCGGCDKRYYAEDEFSVEFKASPDCELNGEPHDWQDVDLRDGRKHPFCAKCDKCKPMSRN